MASRNNPFPAKNKMGRPEYWTEERIDDLIVKLEKYTKRHDVYDIGMFRVENDLTMDNINTICNKSPDFRRTYEIARLKIGSVRQKKALEGDWHAGTIHRDDWKYDKEVRDRQDELREKEAVAIDAATIKQNEENKQLRQRIAELEEKLAKRD